MLTGKVNTKDVDRILRKIRNSSLGIKKAVDQELAVGALLVETDAKIFSPVDKGFNRANIGMVRENFMKYKVAARAPYAIYLEFGTVKMKAQPFMDPAFNANKRLILDNLKAAIRNELKK